MARARNDLSVSGYQTRKWVTPWLRTIGSALGLEQLLILGRDENGSAAALFVLTIAPAGRIRVASYAGGRDSNINMPLVRPDVLLDRDAVYRMLTEGSRSTGVDAFALLNQPSNGLASFIRSRICQASRRQVCCTVGIWSPAKTLSDRWPETRASVCAGACASSRKSGRSNSFRRGRARKSQTSLTPSGARRKFASRRWALCGL